MGLFLVAEDVATAWYHNMINGPAGQTKWGSIEGQCNCGLKISPFLTWDSKITTVVAMMGGLVSAVKERLQRESQYHSFLSRVSTEWGRVFDSSKLDVNVSFAYPSIGFPEPGRADFPNCKVSADTYPKEFLFGVATASYQIEGAWNIDGKGLGMWDEYVRYPGATKNNDTGDVADDFYHKYKEDI